METPQGNPVNGGARAGAGRKPKGYESPADKTCPRCQIPHPRAAFGGASYCPACRKNYRQARDRKTGGKTDAYYAAKAAKRDEKLLAQVEVEVRRVLRQRKQYEKWRSAAAHTAERAAAAQAEISRRQSEGKVCYACGVHKPPADFGKARGRFDGMQDQCTACRVAQSAEARAKDPEKYRAQARAATRTLNRRPEVRVRKLAAKRGKNLDKLASKTEHYWHYVQWRRHCADGFFEALDPRRLHDAHVRAYPKKEAARRQKAMVHPETHHAHVAEYRRMAKRSHLVTRTDVHNNLYVTFKGWLRKRLRHTLAGRGFSWGKLFPYTQECVARHLESRFLPGMGWHNRTDWHIDHIRPIAAFDIPSADSAAFAECFALENLQPLWAIDNIKKGAHSTL